VIEMAKLLHMNLAKLCQMVSTAPLLLPYDTIAKVAFSALTLLGGRKGIWPVKIWGDGGGGHWLDWMEWRPAGWSLCLPLSIFPCTIKSRSSLLASAHVGGP